MNAALKSGEVEELKALSYPGCGGCSNILAAIDQAQEAGERVRGAELLVEFAEAPAVRAGETLVDLRYQRAAGDIVDTHGNIVSTIAAEGPIDTQLRVRRSGSTWSVLGFRQVSG